ncbi:MFS transporter [Chromobacterium sp. IIBBL 290-4]|uniref:MFS transporter n=1 Tax=Chromobacterium sp. IIBBL 290-4 TaxID=2953890 RepID=UPI0020B6A2DF|nr:MFS transporter [Chromobacterium sp. IIBBL 290-4]UTH75358.1 MFS transporter [Chromobacterium sp. IIBBL 290-4]
MRNVYWIGLGAFALGMSSYVTAGLIPLLERDLGVSAASAGQFVTAFSLAYGLGSPLFAALLPASRQRLGLLLALAAFTLANAASAVCASFGALLIARAAAGAGAGVYLALGIAAAATLAPSGKRGQALAIIMAGMSAGTVLGVPLGILLAERIGWPAAMWLITLLGALSFIGLGRALPPLPASASPSLAQRLALLRNGRLVSVILVSFLAAIASLGLYTYLAAVLNGERIALSLWVWGLGGIAGSLLIGPLADRYPARTLLLFILAGLTLSLAALSPALALHPLWALPPIAIWGAVGWALQVPQNQELISESGHHGAIAVALNESALYLGGAAGAGLGGIALAYGLPAWLLPPAAALIGLCALIWQWRLPSAGIAASTATD